VLCLQILMSVIQTMLAACRAVSIPEAHFIVRVNLGTNLELIRNHVIVSKLNLKQLYYSNGYLYFYWFIVFRSSRVIYYVMFPNSFVILYVFTHFQVPLHWCIIGLVNFVGWPSILMTQIGSEYKDASTLSKQNCLRIAYQQLCSFFPSWGS